MAKLFFILLKPKYTSLYKLYTLRSTTNSRQPLKPSNRPSGVSQVKVKVEPFNLSAESRVQQRRLFNVQNTKAQESKRREMEEQRQRAEREAYQKQRQLTMFRARPNPFSAR